MRPENDLKVRVKVPDAKGEKALVTLSAVDVGILNITRYASPDPHAFFFGKLRYGPDQLDVYGRLIEKMQGQKGRLRFGGGICSALPCAWATQSGETGQCSHRGARGVQTIAPSSIIAELNAPQRLLGRICSARSQSRRCTARS